jgi:hypothetical protein
LRIRRQGRLAFGWADGIASIDVFRDHLNEDETIRALQDYDVLCTMRERMGLTGRLFEGLPRLKLVTIVGANLPVLDVAPSRAAQDLPGAAWREPIAGEEPGRPGDRRSRRTTCLRGRGWQEEKGLSTSCK